MRRLSATSFWVVTLWALAAATALAQTAPQIEFEKYELPNGLDVILYEDHSIPLVSVNISYHVGSGNEKPGRTGFAHLFEHMMFLGSQNHDDEYDKPLEKAGAVVNASTGADRTNYWEDVPSNYLELALWLEADRMGFLLPAMTQEKLDTQRDVVRNERRQSYENKPYGKARLILAQMLYPDEHPYSWPIIGSQEDLSAASMEDVSEFFRSYYVPNNASLVIAGDFDPQVAKELVQKYFGPLPPGPAVDRVSEWMPELTSPKRAVAEDNVKLARLYYTWHTPPFFAPGDAEFDLLANVLATGKTSRLYKALVYDQQIAQDVRARQWSREMGSAFRVTVTAREGVQLDDLERAVDAKLEKILRKGITTEELDQARTAWQASFVRRLERTGGFGGVADQLNSYNTYLGDPGRFRWDMERYSKATVAGITEYARRYLDPRKRATLRIVPQGEQRSVASEVDRSQMPGPMAEPTFSPPTIQRAELSNGLQLLVVEDHALPLVQAHLVIKSGWAADPDDRPGAASLTAELLDEGTRTRSALEIAEEAKRLAASLGTGSFFDGSAVSLNVLKNNLDDGLALMADVVLNPTFREEELERQRKIYLGRIQQEAKQPQTAAIKTFLRTLYGEEHPYGQPYTGSGTEESIRAIKRQDLVSYYRTNYLPNNASLIVVGDITLAEAKRKAEKAFGKWKRGTVDLAQVPEAAPITRTQVYIVDKPGAVQSVILAGNMGIKRSDPDRVAFQVMNNALGGKFSSRINLNLREDKGYSYGAASIFLATRGVGPFFVLAPVQTQSTKESLVEILKELREIVSTRPIGEAELEEAKGNIIKGFPRQFQTVGGIASQVGRIVMYDLPDDEWVRYLNALETVTEEQATQAARDHIDPDALLIVVVGDREKIEPGIRELRLGEISYLAVGKP